MKKKNAYLKQLCRIQIQYRTTDAKQEYVKICIPPDFTSFECKLQEQILDNLVNYKHQNPIQCNSKWNARSFFS